MILYLKFLMGIWSDGVNAVDKREFYYQCTLARTRPSTVESFDMLESQVRRYIEELVSSSAGTPNDGSISSVAIDLSDRYIGTKGCRALCEALRQIGNDKVTDIVVMEVGSALLIDIVDADTLLEPSW